MTVEVTVSGAQLLVSTVDIDAADDGRSVDDSGGGGSEVVVSAGGSVVSIVEMMVLKGTEAELKKIELVEMVLDVVLLKAMKLVEMMLDVVLLKMIELVETLLDVVLLDEIELVKVDGRIEDPDDIVLVC